MNDICQNFIMLPCYHIKILHKKFVFMINHHAKFHTQSSGGPFVIATTLKASHKFYDVTSISSAILPTLAVLKH